ncbi:uncharacterized protein DS421_6g188860 [Arachis hypogaea]|nr:uncharacterized protein DS421_6g188860 [Arachis hypogaea]
MVAPRRLPCPCGGQGRIWCMLVRLWCMLVRLWCGLVHVDAQNAALPAPRAGQEKLVLPGTSVVRAGAARNVPWCAECCPALTEGRAGKIGAARIVMVRQN